MARDKTVFVIDDDTALRTAYAAALSAMGYTVETASDGVEGLALIKDKKPALIVLDMLMPNMDGISFLKELRKDKESDSVKIFITSNFEELPEAEGLGVTKYISKIQHAPDAVAAAVDTELQAAS